jgi:hypothetical protein
MKSLCGRFNNYLLVAVIGWLAGGCASSGEGKKLKEASTLRLFREADSDGSNRNTAVPIYRAAPVPVVVERAPFLDAGNLIDAAVVDTVGGFAVRLKFDYHGTLALESVTGASKGRRIAVFSQWTEGRWLAAPKLTTRISDGVFAFTPDASREEIERIVRGLNNVAVMLKNRPRDAKAPAKPKRQAAE